MVRVEAAGLSRRDKIKIGLLVALVLAVPAWVVGPWVWRHVEDFFARPRAQLFGQVLVAILLEAVPFVLVGSIVSGLVEVFVPPERLARLVPRRLGLRLLVGAAAGFILPVCECGIVPVARRLIRKGVPLEMATAFLLAGPIVNPTVVVSTAAAFTGQGPVAMALARVLCGMGVAMLVGLAVALWSRRGAGRQAAGSSCSVEGEVPEAAVHPPHGHAVGASVPARLLGHIVHDFLLLGGYLLVGSALAAGLQTFVPRTVLVSVGRTPWLASAGMMLAAFLLNVCSEADAFLAAAFTQFTFASRLAFLVSGPMLDVKLVAMYVGTMPRRLLVAVLLLVPPLVLGVSELAGLIVGALGG